MSAVVRDGGNVDGGSTLSLQSELSEEETVRVSVDLVAAARRNVGFLRFVKESHWLLERPVIVESVRRSRVVLLFSFLLFVRGGGRGFSTS